MGYLNSSLISNTILKYVTTAKYIIFKFTDNAVFIHMNILISHVYSSNIYGYGGT